MSRVTAAFVCAICDPDDPRPASIMCSNNCGRYVCAQHAMPRKGPGSAMICLSCAEALGILKKPQPEPVKTAPVKVEDYVAPMPLPTVPPAPAAMPAPASMPTPEPIQIPAADETLIAKATAAPLPQAEFSPPAKPESPSIPKPAVDEAAAAPWRSTRLESDTALASQVAPLTFPPIAKEDSRPVLPPVNETMRPGQAARRLLDPEPEPKSTASETIVSQRGNTLQVPKVTLGRPPQPIPNTKPSQTGRFNPAATIAGLSRETILLAVGAIVLGIIGLALIIAALQ